MSIDDTISNVVIKKPTASVLTLAFSSVGLGALAVGAEGVFMTTALASPLTLAVASTIGAINLFRNKSGLSKVFSAVSVGTGVVMAGALMQDSSGWDWLEPVMKCLPATAVASAANLASHYTRDRSLSLKLTNKPDDPSV